MKVAVIGSGLAGLTTAYLLRKEGVEVWLLEKSGKLGFHSHSVEVPESDVLKPDVAVASQSPGKGMSEGDEQWIVDVPMRGFQGGYYPLLLSLYRRLGLPVVSADYTFSFSSPLSTYFIHSGSSGLSIPSLPSNALSSPFALVHHVLTFLGVAICYLLLLVLSFMAWHDLLPSAISSPELTLRGFTAHLSNFLARPITIPVIRYAPWTPLGETFEFFIAQIVLPLFSSVGTMTSADVWNLPVRVILEYVHKTLGTSHYHLARGHSAADVARLLSDPVREQGEGYVRLLTEIMGLKQDEEGGVRVVFRTEGGGDDEIMVDRVVLATQASVAHRLLKGFERDLRQAGLEKERRRIDRMKQALSSVRYRETIVVTHRDTSVLPGKANQRDLNFFLPTGSPSTKPSFAAVASKGTGKDTLRSGAVVPYFSVVTESDPVYTMATQVIQHPGGSSRGRAVLQTTNPVIPIDPRTVLSVSRLERALPLRRPRETLSALRPTLSRIYIAGSYAYPGIPLLEGCVGSAKLAVEAILRDRYPAEVEDSRATDGTDTVGSAAMQDENVHVGGVDWTRGRGGWVERVWTWRRRPGVWS
ncbi:hypothetical protein I317_03557 [Kwoniella heveanensis CBS 569]|nr:hypothetical protein I317_03557 [Kwoniella heveanensis CBS 569]